jgi:hypothetical protein
MFRIVIGDILHHLTHALLLIAGEGNHPLLDVVAKYIAESAAEVLVARI